MADQFEDAWSARTTSHADEIAGLRDHALQLALAADLLEAHDETGISLDAWQAARAFVERHIGKPILENGV